MIKVSFKIDETKLPKHDQQDMREWLSYFLDIEAYYFGALDSNYLYDAEPHGLEIEEV